MEESDIEMLYYFWTEKGDAKRWIGYEKWAKENYSEAFYLDILLRRVEMANDEVRHYINGLNPTPAEKKGV